MDAVKPRLLGLYSPAAGSGKSVVADALRFHLDFVNVKFAGPLKAMTRGLLAAMSFAPETVERMIEGDLKEAVIPGFSTVTPRHLMVTLGTDWGREAVDNELWIKVAEAAIGAALAAGRSVVVDDMRFPNEFDLIKRLGGDTVRIWRPQPSREGGAKCEGLLEEQDFDWTIYNTGTIEVLRQAATKIGSFR